MSKLDRIVNCFNLSVLALFFVFGVVFVWMNGNGLLDKILFGAIK